MDTQSLINLEKILLTSDIDGYPGYTLYSDGRVYSHKTNKFLTLSVHSNGYVYVDLCKDGHKKSIRLHILIAKHFIPNPDNLPEVNHKNGNKLECDMYNLEWVTRSDNVKHAIDNGLLKCCKITEQILNGEVIATFKSCAEASRITGIGESTINNACAGRRMSAGGYQWRYKYE